MEMDAWPRPAQSLVKPLCAPVQDRWRGGQQEKQAAASLSPVMKWEKIKERLEVFAVLL